MDWGTAGDITATASPTAALLLIVGFAFRAVMRGDIVPRQIFEDMRVERNLHRERADTAEKALREQLPATTRLTTEVVRSLRPADGNPGDES